MASLAIAEPAADTELLHLRPEPDLATLAYAYVRWQSEGLFSRIFPTRPNLSLRDYLNWHDLPEVECAGVFSGDELLGIGWIVQSQRIVDQIIGEVAVGFFRAAKFSQWVEGVQMLLGWGFSRGLTVAYGVSPMQNRDARALSLTAGMRHTGVLPYYTVWEGKATDAALYTLKKEDWMGRRWHGFRRN